MIKLDLENLKKIKAPHGLSTTAMKDPSAKIRGMLKKIDARNQGFYKVIDDSATVKEIERFARACAGKYSDIVVLGIGGSALGTICLQQSLKPLFENEAGADECREAGRGSKKNAGIPYAPKLHVLDNIDAALIADFDLLLKPRKTLFIVVTKSGATPETLAQYAYYSNKVSREKLPLKKHFVFITGPGNNLLRRIARKEQIPCFDVPENVGGRFSVLTPVGLLPAALIGIDVRKLLAGAREMRKTFLGDDFNKNIPYRLALVQHLLAKKGKTINVLMPYSQKLIRFADWYRQLLAESTGKEGKGLTPVSALGATDQHSQSQLYNEGPNDKLVIFINTEKAGPMVKIPAADREITGILPKGLTFNRLLRTEMRGTTASLTKNDRPNITITIPHVDEASLGGLFMLFMGATAFLGEMMGINAYDQPGVELSKKITRDLLKKNI